MSVEVISISVNGSRRDLTVRPGATLLEVLREQFALTGVRAGCREGGCGSCSVLIDGVLTLACLTPVARLGEASVTTVEGLASGQQSLNHIQQAFVDSGASQCGFCTSGMIMAAHALLSTNPQPSRDDVVEAISGNVCRCTGYEPIVNAILTAADQAPEPESPNK